MKPANRREAATLSALLALIGTDGMQFSAAINIASDYGKRIDTARL